MGALWVLHGIGPLFALAPELFEVPRVIWADFIPDLAHAGFRKGFEPTGEEPFALTGIRWIVMFEVGHDVAPSVTGAAASPK